eukprot:tig00021494_g21924.t1
MSAWRLRGVSRAWKGAFELTTWAPFRMRLLSGDVARAEEAARRGKLGIRGDLEVELRGQARGQVDLPSLPEQARGAHPRLLLDALARGGGAWALRGVDVDIRLPAGANLAAHALGCLRSSAGPQLRSFALASGAPLQGTRPLCPPPPSALWGHLLPLLPALAVLHLPAGLPLDAAGAAAIASGLPALRDLKFRPDSPEAVAALAPAPLERLALHGGTYSWQFGDGNPAALASLAHDAPCGASLLSFAPCVEGSAALAPHNLRALAAMPRLQRIEGWVDLERSVTQEDVASLARRGLLSLSLACSSNDQIRGLAEVARACAGPGPGGLESLDLCVNNVERAMDGPALARLLRLAGPALREARLLSSAGPLPAAALAALAACPRLQRLTLRSFVNGWEDVAPLVALAGHAALPPREAFLLRVGFGRLGLEPAGRVALASEFVDRAKGALSEALGAACNLVFL